MLFFGWIMFFFGIHFVHDFGSDLMESIPFTNFWYYTALPVSGFLIMLFALRSQLNTWLGTGPSAPVEVPNTTL
jgi:TRAP-type C4-dicarboxylate transport system permease small subunit